MNEEETVNLLSRDPHLQISFCCPEASSALDYIGTTKVIAICSLDSYGDHLSLANSKINCKDSGVIRLNAEWTFNRHFMSIVI